nr:serine/threonine-protein kinase SAPK1 [Ipomoea trifida]
MFFIEKVADVMLVGAYPFEDPDDPRNFKKTITVKFDFAGESSSAAAASPLRNVSDSRRSPVFAKPLPVDDLTRRNDAIVMAHPKGEHGSAVTPAISDGRECRRRTHKTPTANRAMKRNISEN